LTDRFAAIRAELGIPTGFPREVLTAAEEAARRPAEPEADLTDLPFVTLDPPGSTDLDQAMLLRRRAGGYHVDYAIADVPAFVDPSGPVAAEALRRGQTIYSPDLRTPLHPPVLSEHAASLLPDQSRPAFVWRFDLDGNGEVERVDLVRALVRSRARLDYDGVQALADADPAARANGGTEPAAEPRQVALLLREIGRLRQDRERARGGASLRLPEQEVVPAGTGFGLRLRPPVPAEDWNAQLSLMTGMAAARIMLAGGVGILRTMPPPDSGAVDRFRTQAARLGVRWPDGASYGELLRTLDPADPVHLALLHAAASLFRGAGYRPVTEPVTGPADPGQVHAAVAAPYAHVTAPLRRLVDRFGLAACHALHRGAAAADWVLAGLPLLPQVMAATDRLAGEVERRCLDAVESASLAGRDGESFAAVVVDVDRDGDGGHVQLLDPPVLARCAGSLQLGSRVRVRMDGSGDAGVVKFSVQP